MSCTVTVTTYIVNRPDDFRIDSGSCVWVLNHRWLVFLCICFCITLALSELRQTFFLQSSQLWFQSWYQSWRSKFRFLSNLDYQSSDLEDQSSDFCRTLIFERWIYSDSLGFRTIVRVGSLTNLKQPVPHSIQTHSISFTSNFRWFYIEKRSNLVYFAFQTTRIVLAYHSDTIYNSISPGNGRARVLWKIRVWFWTLIYQGWDLETSKFVQIWTLIYQSSRSKLELWS